MYDNIKQKAGDMTAQGKWASFEKARALWGALLTLAVWLEFIAVVPAIRLTDPPGGEPVVYVMAALFCLVTLACLHIPIGRVRNLRNGWVLLSIFLLVMVVTLSNASIPYIKASTAGSWNGAASASIGEQLQTMAFVTRAVVIAMAAVVASWGVHMLIDGRRGQKAAEAFGADGVKLNQVVFLVEDTAAQSVRAQHVDGIQERRDILDMATGIAAGAKKNALELMSYAEMATGAYPDQAQVRADFERAMAKPWSCANPKIREAVALRLEQHCISINDLPEDPMKLAPATRQRVIEHANFLLQLANRDRIEAMLAA